jgi:hypothetical protein
METLKIMGFIGIFLSSVTLLCTFGGAETLTIGLWALATIGFALAQSIVCVVKSNKN